MLLPLELSIFDTIAGLPVHILVVHLAVVILPIAAIGQALLIFIPQWRARWATPTLVGLVIGTGAAFVAKQSGEALAGHIGTPATHAFWGDILPIVAGFLMVVAAAWWFLQRREVSARTASVTLPTLVTGLMSAALAIAAAVITVVVGHTGAQAAWGGRLDAGSGTVVTAPAASSSASASSTKSTTAAAPAGALTMAAVKQHNTASNCWSVINGNVYDLTAWVDQHPGGKSVIVRICGTDATTTFDRQHGGQGDPAAVLATFKKGALVS